jgi:hypothetical protein
MDIADRHTIYYLPVTRRLPGALKPPNRYRVSLTQEDLDCSTHDE